MNLMYFSRQGFSNNYKVFYFPEPIRMAASKYHLRDIVHTFYLLSTTFFNRRYRKVDLSSKSVLNLLSGTLFDVRMYLCMVTVVPLVILEI